MIRKAKIEDAEAIHDAHMLSIQSICSKDHSIEEINAWGMRPFNEIQRTSAIQNQNVWVVELDNKIEGYGHLRVYEKDGQKLAHIMGLYLTQKALGQGYGKQIFLLMLTEAKFQKVETINLESTLTAHTFYKKMGFIDSAPQMTVELGGAAIRCIPMKMDLRPIMENTSMPPNLETERLILRPITIDDLSSYQQNFSDYEIIRYLATNVPWPYPKNGVHEFYYKVLLSKQGQNYWHWGIFLKDSPLETIGGVDLWRESSVDNRGFWLARKHWGKGYMTEVANRINEHAFNELGFDVLYFGNAVTNIGSRRIKEKTGAAFIGTRPFKFVDPNVTETENWILTKEKWLQFREQQQK